jgi:hypothetical protein
MSGERFKLEQLDEEDPFEIDSQAAHLFKHPHLGSTISTMSGPVIRCSIQPNLRRIGSCAPRSAGGCSWSRWLQRAAGIQDGAVRSAATKRRTSLPPSTGETDDEHPYDT